MKSCLLNRSYRDSVLSIDTRPHDSSIFEYGLSIRDHDWVEKITRKLLTIGRHTARPRRVPPDREGEVTPMKTYAELRVRST